MDALVTKTPAKTLRAIVAELNSVDDPDDTFVEMIGVGPLETLLHRGHETALWDEIERLARTDPRFRQALAHVQATTSPELGRRRRLLEELDDGGADGEAGASA